MGSDHLPAASAVPGEVITLSPRAGAYARLRRAITDHRAYRNELLLVIASAVMDSLAFVTTTEFDSAGVTTRVIGFGLATAGGAVLIARRRYPMQVLIAVVLLQAVFVLCTDAATRSFGCALMVALYTVSRYRGPLDIGFAGCLAVAVQLLRALPGAGEPVAQACASGFGGAALVITVGVGTAKWQQQLAINRQLRADRAVTEERRRIARELHDIVAHHITTMYLMSGGARATLERDPETAREALFTLEASGRTALGEMRQLLGVLRSTDGPEEAPSEPQPGMPEIHRLITESRAAGLPIEYEEIGERRSLSAATGLTLYRIVQEALTNTRKHSGAARASVRVRHLPDRVVLEVLDDGAGGSAPPSGITGSGYGLMGMRERVTLHGGTLEAGHRPEGGFRVVADVPLPPSEPAWTG
ncbi:sensor histidine kinase [Embleya scabrispora]|uniref:sensor histidine kinase n=1 Tax=Embleya scabrispora TaxID=159449 RepID=UPI00037FEB54|nr:sensor histidine kinase [Embleya scabrispora]MYS83892.1 sensor histidine kinase [Streptomyces sp. SID5474]